MIGINSVKNYKYSILVKKIRVLKRLKKDEKKVCSNPHLCILQIVDIQLVNILLDFFTVSP